MNTKYIISLTALVTLTGASCRGAASKTSPDAPIGSLARLYESVAGEVSDFADVTPGILESLYRKDLLELATIGRENRERFPNLYQDAMREFFRQKVRQFLQQHNGNVQAALFDAAENDKPWAIDYLVQNGANVNAKTNENQTVLMFAAQFGHEALVAQLLAAGANVDEKNNYDITALMWAAQNGHEAIVAQLLAAGADVNAKANCGWTALTFAARFGHEAVAQLLAARADLNAKDNFGGTALMKAAESGHGAVVAQLLAVGADVNAKNNHGETALKAAERTVTNGYGQAHRDRARAIVDLLTRGR